VRRHLVGWLNLLALAVLLPVAIAACAFGGGDEKAATVPTATTTATSERPRAFVRTCETRVFGTLDDPAWQKHTITAGPLSFYDADQYAPIGVANLDPIPGRSGYYSGQKLLVLVRPGEVATVVVPDSARPYAALLYNPADWNDRNQYRIEDGESAVTFKACKKEATPVDGSLDAMTQFNGGLVVAGVRCLPLEVFVRGEERTIPVTLSFGAGRCD
jgi:hypothetical protein